MLLLSAFTQSFPFSVCARFLLMFVCFCSKFAHNVYPTCLIDSWWWPFIKFDHVLYFIGKWLIFFSLFVEVFLFFSSICVCFVISSSSTDNRLYQSYKNFFIVSRCEPSFSLSSFLSLCFKKYEIYSTTNKTWIFHLSFVSSYGDFIPVLVSSSRSVQC